MNPTLHGTLWDWNSSVSWACAISMGVGYASARLEAWLASRRKR